MFDDTETRVSIAINVFDDTKTRVSTALNVFDDTKTRVSIAINVFDDTKTRVSTAVNVSYDAETHFWGERGKRRGIKMLNDGVREGFVGKESFLCQQRQKTL